MRNHIVEALKAKNTYALAMHAAVLAEKNKGAGVFSANLARSADFGSDYIDLLQYCSAFALDEEPKINQYRKFLLIEKGYEKVGNFFRARVAEYRHLFKAAYIEGFGQNNLAKARDQYKAMSAEISIKIQQDNADFIFFHGMMRPLYQEMAVLDYVRKTLPRGKILDVCSDNGDFALYAAMSKYDVTYAQPEGYLLNAIDKRLKLRQLKAQKLPLTPSIPLPEFDLNSYDVIVLHNSLANHNDPFLLLEECRAGLKHDGLLFVNRYPFDCKVGGIIADSAARRESIVTYLEKHFTRLGNSGLFRKI
ncbi:MAG: hypothetical protein VYC19_10380 [Pseudomonadota bacterium]|nr:hypothetical protein [Pseudomonadota bacterium]MEC9234914.1 hypothetical protein [Pseudomonadota bacterium]